MNNGPGIAAGGHGRPPVLSSMWRFRWTVLTITLLAALLGWAGSQLQAVRYEATSEMLLTDPRDAGLFQEVGPRSDASRHVANQAQRLTSSTVAARTAELLGDGSSPAEIRDRVEAVASQDADLITVTAAGSTAESAAALADAVVEAYQDVASAEMRALADDAMAQLDDALAELQARIDRADQMLADDPSNEVARLERDAAANQLVLDQQLLERIAMDAALYGSGVQSVELAELPESPVAPRTVTNTLIGAFLGVGLAAPLTVWRAGALRRVERRHEPAEILHVPLLGTVPLIEELAEKGGSYPTASAPYSPAAEAFRFVGAALEATLDEDVATPMIVVTSASAGDGKTTVALNLALALGVEDQPVVLVDADARVRGLGEVTGLNDRPGLVELASVDCPLDEVTHSWQPTERAFAEVVPVGNAPIDPAQFFRTTRYRVALNRLRERTHLLMVDAPPLLAVSDASAIAGSADGIVLVVNAGTPVHVLADLRERLEFVGTPVLGYVFNRASPRRGSPRYGYGYGYGQHRHSDAAVLPRRSVTPEEAILAERTASEPQAPSRSG